MTRRADAFQTIHSEGGLLPPDLLRRLLEPKEKLPGTQPADYGLAPGERLNEVLTQSWNRLRRHWAAFREAAKNLAAGQPGDTLTNDLWNLPLLREFGFGVLPFHPGPEINGRLYPIHYQSGPTPIHLIGCGRSLDRRVSGVQGNPHGLVQEFLNRSPDHVWALVANGLRLRVLRDSQALSRQSYLEFDLEALFDGEVYADFVLLWLVAHATRFAPPEAGKPESCWLEQWTKLANEQGARALGDLRQGVERALQTLGQGLVGHPRNTALREALRDGTLALNDLHGQLLRVVYRLIFLFVAEDRTLDGVAVLHPRPDSPAAGLARNRYTAHYSTARLRQLAGTIKGSRHGDLWQQFNLLVGALSGEERFSTARQALALPALGSWLWNPASTADLNAAPLTGATGVELSNADFLEVLRHLSFTRQGNVLRPVDYKNLGAEELGGVYESLLALTPHIEGGGSRFTFDEFAGNERKTSGSYYTPDSLVQCLLDSALDPVVEAAIADKHGAEAEQALLALKVCDPAVGSGHFLVGAAHRLARHLARVRAQAEGDSEASPLLYQTALREVIGRCLYGVDVNPMSAELCRVNLWLEALEPGKPLSFLDHHIRVGNSLLGATPELIAAGIPDEAFKPITGDDKQACTALKKRNKMDSKGYGPAFQQQDKELQARLQQAAAELDALPDAKPEDIRRKESVFQQHEQTEAYRQKKLLADAWCAAFVIQKIFKPSHDPRYLSTEPFGITQRLLKDIATNRVNTSDQLLLPKIQHLVLQYQFFHGHLAFPEVFANGGFDVVLGNPPWERVKLQEKEWFAERSPEIANAPNAAARKRLIEGLKAGDPALYQQFLDGSRQAEGESHLLRNSGRYPLCGRGDINVYTVFAEGMWNQLNASGRMGCVLPSGIATDDTTKFFFQDVVDNKSLVSLFDFENRLGLFPAVDSRMKFCLFTAGNGERPTAETAEFVFFAHGVEDLRDPERRFTLSPQDIALLNPNTRTCPIFRSRRDAELTKAIYRRVPVLIKEGPPEVNPWGIKFSTMFHMSNDSHLFRTREQLEAEGWWLVGNVFEQDEERYLPLYEAKMIHHFDHRWAGYVDSETCDLSTQEKNDTTHLVCGRYWVDRWEVYLRITRLPKGLIEGLRNKNLPIVTLSMAYLLFGKWLIAKKIDLKKLFQAWCSFIQEYPFARSLAPTRIGLCGDNPPCLNPLGPNYLPAEPIDQIKNTDRQKTAWYEVDNKAVSAFINVIKSYRIEINTIVKLENDSDVFAYAEWCLEAATPKWLLGFRDITNTTNERTVIIGVMSIVGVGHTCPITFLGYNAAETGLFIASLCTFANDFVARQKIGGTHLTYGYFNQLPILPPDTYTQPCPWSGNGETLHDWILPRVLELTYTAWDLESFAQDCGFNGPPFRWDEARRFLLRCELDAAFFHLYGIERDDVAYIMDTFPIVKRKDEAAHGRYRTKDTILDMYDAMIGGQPYQTQLDPPPADVRCCHPARG